MPSPVIHEDRNGLRVHAAEGTRHNGDENWGHRYNFLAGRYPDGIGGTIQFQCGPVPDRGVNGLTNEAVLAILIHRIGVLNEKLPCEQNELVLGNLRTALALLEDRTADRVARGVEGKETV